jgi:uncharacterized membrane protein
VRHDSPVTAAPVDARGGSLAVRPAPDDPVPVLPSSDDPVVAASVHAIGGPPGRHARLDRSRFWTPVRWLVLLTLLTSLLGFWQKSPCRVQPWAEQYQYTRACYTDVYALYFAERLHEAAVPYLDHPVEYPVITGAAMAAAARVVSLFPEPERPRRFYDVTWVLLTACALVVVVTTARLAGGRPWDAALFALAPALVLHGTTNWDLAAMALTGLGLLQWSRRRPVAAGVLLGLGTAAKLYPALLLLPLGLLCLRAGRLRSFWRTAVPALVVPLLVTAPVYLASPSFASTAQGQVQVAAAPLDRLGQQGLSALAPHTSATAPDGTPVVGVNATYRFVELNRSRPADWDSLWFVLQLATGDALDDDDEQQAGPAPSRLNAAVAVTLVAGLAGVAVLALRAPRRPRLPQLLFLVVVVFLLTNKVWSPQFSLWLVPLLALARPRWRSFLVWQAAEALLLLARFWFFIGNDDPAEGIGTGWFVSAVLLRDVVLLGIAGLVVRDVLQPQHDVVRPSGVDDPAGGELDGAPDVRAPAARRTRRGA